MGKTIIVFVALSLIILPQVSLAAYDGEGHGGIWDMMVGGSEYGGGGGLNGIEREIYGESGHMRSLPETVMLIIRVFLELLGTIFMVIIIYAGFKWMTAGGNEEQIGDAKKLIKNGVIGLAIIVCAYAITLFVTNALLQAT